MSNELTCCTEEHRVSGERLVSRVKELIHQGNVRRVIIRDEGGHSIMEIPLTMGVVGAILLPSLVALGAIAALASNYTVVVERLEESESAAAAAR
jgi:Domain of unknown function (DUF4342)